jgi:hypothetical protein
VIRDLVKHKIDGFRLLADSSTEANVKQITFARQAAKEFNTRIVITFSMRERTKLLLGETFNDEKIMLKTGNKLKVVV